MRALIPLLCAAALVSCAKKNSASSAPTVLEGRWAPTCTGDDTQIVEYTGSTQKIYYNVYESAGCAGALKGVATQTFSFVLGTPNKIDFTQTAFTYVAKTQNLVDYANSHAFCGMTNWQLDKEQSIADKTCDLDDIPNTNGKTVYSIYQLDTAATPNTLQFGKTTTTLDGSSDAKRPTELSTTKAAKQ